MFRFLLETRLLLVRCLKSTLRTPVWVIMGLFQPVLYLLLFAPLLDNLKFPGLGTTHPLNIFTPGLLVMMALFGAGFAGFSIIQDLRSGVIERLRVTPASRLAMLLGMILRDVIVLLVQCVLLILIGMLMGLTIDPMGALLLFGLMLIIGLMMASASYALALILKDEGSMAATINLLVLPLMLLSGVMLPISLAPQILQNIAKVTPFSYAVDAARAMVNGHLGDQSIVIALSLSGILMVLGLLWATNVFRKATA
jgi:ABC-2 type transport system permease protein